MTESTNSEPLKLTVPLISNLPSLPLFQTTPIMPLIQEHKARKPGTTTLKAAIDEMLRAYQLKNKYSETYLVAFWEKLVGKSIASRTGRLYVSEGTLYVQILSAPLRQELVLAKTKLIELLNREMGEEVVRDVIFI